MVDTLNPKKDEDSGSDGTNGVSTESVGKEKPISEIGGFGSNSFYRGFGRPGDMKVNLASEHEDMNFQEKSLPEVKKESKNDLLADFHPASEKEEKPSPSTGIVSKEEPKETVVIAEKEAEKSETPMRPFYEAEHKQKEPERGKHSPKPVFYPMEEPKTKEHPKVIPDVIPEQIKSAPKVAMPVKSMKVHEPVVWRKILILFGGGVVVAAILGGISYFGLGYYYDSKLNDQNTELEALHNEQNSLTKSPAALELPKVVPPPVSTAPVPVAPQVQAPVETPPIQEVKPETPTVGAG